MFSFIETRLFTRLVQAYLADEQYAALQRALTLNPAAGTVIPGSGGIRKAALGSGGTWKRGGYRVIYYVCRADGVMWMLTIYPKNVMDDIPVATLARIREEIERGHSEA